MVISSVSMYLDHIQLLADLKIGAERMQTREKKKNVVRVELLKDLNKQQYYGG